MFDDEKQLELLAFGRDIEKNVKKQDKIRFINQYVLGLDLNFTDKIFLNYSIIISL